GASGYCPSVCLSADGQRTDLARLHALHSARGNERAHCAVRQLQSGPAEACLPPWFVAPLWPHDADHRRHSLQFLAAASAVAAAAAARPAWCRVQPAKLCVGALFRLNPQLPPLFLAADVPVRRLAGGVRQLPAGPRSQTRAPARTYPVCALCHLVADE